LLAVAVREGPLEFLARVKEAAHDGSLGNACGLGHLIVTQSVYFAHDDGGTVVARQKLERMLDSRRDFSPAHDVDRVGALHPADKRRIQVLVLVGVVQIHIGCSSPMTGAPKEIDAEVGDDAVEPREEGRIPVEVVQMLVDAQKRLLREFTGVVLVVDNGQGQHDRPSLVSLDKLSKCHLVSTLRPLNKRTVYLRILRAPCTHFFRRRTRLAIQFDVADVVREANRLSRCRIELDRGLRAPWGNANTHGSGTVIALPRSRKAR